MMTSLVLTGQIPHLLGIAGESQQLRCWLPTLHWHVSDDIWHKVVPQHCQRPRSALSHGGQERGGSHGGPAGASLGGSFRIPGGGQGSKS